MATVVKDFKIKSGLIVEGTNGTINNFDILTKKQADQDYIIELIGGETLVKSVSNEFDVSVAGELSLDRVVVDAYYDAAGSADTAEDNARAYTDAELLNYTTTANLDTTIDGYGYLKSADLSGYATENYADNAASTAQQNAEDYADGLINDASNSSTEVWSAYKTSTEIGLAESDANAYTDTALESYTPTADLDTTIDGYGYLKSGDLAGYATETYADNAAATAEANANAYTDNAISGLDWKQAVHLLYDAAIPVLSGSGATQLIIDGHDPLGDADSGYRILLAAVGGATTDGIYVYNSTGGSWTLTRAEDADAFGELIGAAVYVMEGTQYGSTSWVQSNHYITNFSGQLWTQFSGQGSVTAGTGIIVSGLEVSVDTDVIATQVYADGAVGTHSDYTTNVHGVTGNVVGTTDSQTLTNKTIDGSSNTISNIANASLVNDSITINGYSTALGSSVTLDTDDVSEGVNQYFTDSRAKDSAADLLTNATLSNITITGSGAGLTITAENGVADSTTDDLDEGINNLYYTESRAKADAAELLTGATLTNISITGDGSGLTITAENGVADSDTDDLTEGTTNLYFTDQRAVDALQGTDSMFTTVSIDEIALQVAATVSAPTAGVQTAYAWAKADYRSAEFLVKVAYGTHTEISKVLLTLDTSDGIAITEYGIVGTNGSASTVSATISGTDVQLLVTTNNNNSTVKVVGTLLA